MSQLLAFCIRLACFTMIAGATSVNALAQSDGVTMSIGKLDVNGLQRKYALEQFHTSAAHGKLPIIIYLHGLFGDINQPEPLRFALPFDTVPDIEPSLIVRPQGVDGKWNAPAEDSHSRRAFVRRLLGIDHAPADDVAFLRRLISVLIAQDHGDPERVYVAGVSAGGYMAARVACELDDVVTAVAIVAATARKVTLAHCGGVRPVPVLLMTSTTDPTVLYVGSDQNASAPDTIWFFKSRNGCKVRTERPLPHLDANVNSTVSLIKFTHCADDADVLFYRVDGSGHSVPSKAPPEPGDWAASGSRNRDIDAAQVVWTFFRNRKLASP